MSEDTPMFVKITGPGRYQVKPFSRRGWAMMVGWIVLNTATLCLLLIPAMREQWWIVLALDLLVTVPFILFTVRAAVPIDQVSGRRSGPA